MKAAYYERVGLAAEVLQLADLPDPVPAPTMTGSWRSYPCWSGHSCASPNCSTPVIQRPIG